MPCVSNAPDGKRLASSHYVLVTSFVKGCQFFIVLFQYAHCSHFKQNRLPVFKTRLSVLESQKLVFEMCEFNCWRWV